MFEGDKMGLLELLQAGDVEKFNESRSGSRVEFFAEELAGLVLRGADLQGANLDKSDFTGTDLTEANLVRAYMSDIDGTEMILDGVFGMKIKLRDAWLEKADLTGADFSRGDLSGAVLKDTKGEGIRCIGARLKEADANNASWPLADFTEASLKGADFSGADLSRAKLTEAKATHAVLKGTNLSGADAAGVILAGAQLQGAILQGARLVNANLAGADLTGADLRHADLTKANLTDAVLDGANLTSASLVDACLDGATMKDAVIDDTDMTGVDAGALGLTGDELELLAGFGARFDPDAPLIFDDACAAVLDGRVAALWLNPDSADAPTLRWMIGGGGQDRQTGVLPVSGASVLAHAIVATSKSYALLALVDRANGETLMRWDLHVDGTVGPPVTLVLGYEPAVLPVFRADGDALLMWGLARRGPTIVVHRDASDGEGFKLLSSEGRSQARGFLGRSYPVLLCKAGILMTVGARGLGAPLSAPDGFPNRVCVAVPTTDKLLTVWNTQRVRRDPGGLRMQWLGGRAAGELDVLTTRPEVNAIDGVPYEDGALLAWTEDDGPSGGRIFVAYLPDGRVEQIDFPDEPVDGIRILEGPGGVGEPMLAMGTLTGALIVSDLKGAVLAKFEDTESF
jgi:uncharacterized protein YjbI with pentapeptide repeats